jgi:hypothetical protein
VAYLDRFLTVRKHIQHVRQMPEELIPLFSRFSKTPFSTTVEVVQFHPKVARFDMPSMKTHSLSLCYTIWVIFFTIVAKASPYIYALTFKLEVVLRKICCILRAVVLFGALDGFLFVVC